jgi:hypothetical protein
MSYSDQLRNLADEFFAIHNHGGTAKEILRWAYDNGKWAPHPDDFIRAGAEQLARAMREDTETDPQGRDIRTKHVLVENRGGEQLLIWNSGKIMNRDQMELSFQYRRRLIKNDCVQLKTEVDSYNENKNPGRPVQMILDFTEDVEEEMLLRKSKLLEFSISD